MAGPFAPPNDLGYEPFTNPRRNDQPSSDYVDELPNYESPWASLKINSLVAIQEEVEAPEEQSVDGRSAVKRRRLNHDCDRCSRSFTEKRSLTRHRRNCGTSERIACGYLGCEKSFARRDLHRRHLREVHQHKRRNVLGDSPSLDMALQKASGEVREIAHGAGMDVYSFGSQSARTAEQSPSDVGMLTERGAIATMLDSELQHTSAELPEPAQVDLVLEACSTVDTRASRTSDAESTTSSADSTDMTSTDDSVETSNDADATSITSISTVSSVQSRFSVRLPFRVKPNPGVTHGGDPRSRPVKNPKPCPLCKKDLGALLDESQTVQQYPQDRHGQITQQPVAFNDGQAVKDHLDEQLRHVNQKSTHPRCHVCQIRFVHQRDLDWHLQSVDAEAQCGFGFEHGAPCNGHHPPCVSNEEQAHHLAFTRHLRTWEAAQLADFRRYVDDYAFGEARTTAPPYGTSQPMYRRSTGSLVTLRSTLSKRSKWSTPAYVNYSSPFSNTLMRLDKLQKVITRRYISQEQLDSMFSDAVSAGNLERCHSLFSRGAKIGGAERLVTFASIATINGDHQMLQFLFRAEALGIFKESRQRQSSSPLTSSERVWTMSKILPTQDLAGLDSFRDSKAMVDFALCFRCLLDYGVPLDQDWLSCVVRRYVSRLSEPRVKHDVASSLDDQKVLSNFLAGAVFFSRCHRDEVDLTTVQCLVKFGGFQDNEVIYKIAQHDLLEILEAVLSHDTCTAIPRKILDNALCIACRFCAYSAARYLLEKGADPNARFSDPDQNWAPYEGWSPLVGALYGHPSETSETLIRTLLAIGSDPNEECHLTRSSTESWHDGTTLLHAMVVEGKQVYVDLLLEYGADVNRRDANQEVPLAIALAVPNPSMVHFILERGPDRGRLSMADQATLELAMTESDMQIDELLRTYKPSIRTALVLAVHRDHPKIVELLLHYAGDINRINVKDIPDHPLLHYAVQRDCEPEIIQLLLRQGAAVNQSNIEGQTALHYAALYKRFPAVELLCNSGADVNHACKHRWTPLHLAVLVANNDLAVEALLHWGANVAAKDSFGNTVLDRAVHYARWSYVPMLVEFGLDVNSRYIEENGDDGKPILQLALRARQWAVAVALLERGARLTQEDITLIGPELSKPWRLDDSDPDVRGRLQAHFERYQRDPAQRIEEWPWQHS